MKRATSRQLLVKPGLQLDDVLPQSEVGLDVQVVQPLGGDPHLADHARRRRLEIRNVPPEFFDRRVAAGTRTRDLPGYFSLKVDGIWIC